MVSGSFPLVGVGLGRKKVGFYHSFVARSLDVPLPTFPAFFRETCHPSFLAHLLGRWARFHITGGCGGESFTKRCSSIIFPSQISRSLSLGRTSPLPLTSSLAFLYLTNRFAHINLLPLLISAPLRPGLCLASPWVPASRLFIPRLTVTAFIWSIAIESSPPQSPVSKAYVLHDGDPRCSPGMFTVTPSLSRTSFICTPPSLTPYFADKKCGRRGYGCRRSQCGSGAASWPHRLRLRDLVGDARAVALPSRERPRAFPRGKGFQDHPECTRGPCPRAQSRRPFVLQVRGGHSLRRLLTPLRKGV